MVEEQEAMSIKKSLEPVVREFKEPKPRKLAVSKEEISVPKPEHLTKPARRSSSLKRDSAKPRKSFQNKNSVILPAEMIATRPVPPLSKEEKSVVLALPDALED
jgi:hypothetical protein